MQIVYLLVTLGLPGLLQIQVFPLFFPSLMWGGLEPEFDRLLKDYIQGGRNKRIILSQTLWGGKSKHLPRK